MAAYDVPRREVPGEPGLWGFILADMTLFAALFAAALVVRADQPGVYRSGSESLHQGLGVADTVLLLTGSALVATAVRSARGAGVASALRALELAAGCAVAFVALKILEWGLLVHAGHRPSSNDFFELYFMLTGMHLVHAAVGTGALLAMRSRLRSVEPVPQRSRFVEGGASYWHMVDALWLVLFPVLYLIGL